MAAVAMAGFNRGTHTCINVLNLLLPSICAASSIALGICLIKVVMINMENGIPIAVYTNIRDSRLSNKPSFKKIPKRFTTPSLIGIIIPAKKVKINNSTCFKGVSS